MGIVARFTEVVMNVTLFIINIIFLHIYVKCQLYKIYMLAASRVRTLLSQKLTKVESKQHMYITMVKTITQQINIPEQNNVCSVFDSVTTREEYGGIQVWFSFGYHRWLDYTLFYLQRGLNQQALQFSLNILGGHNNNKYFIKSNRVRFQSDL